MRSRGTGEAAISRSIVAKHSARRSGDLAPQLFPIDKDVVQVQNTLLLTFQMNLVQVREKEKEKTKEEKELEEAKQRATDAERRAKDAEDKLQLLQQTAPIAPPAPTPAPTPTP